MKEADSVDILVQSKEGAELVKRVMLYKIYSQPPASERPKVCIITWKSGFADESVEKKKY
jgi:hypothetical protein